MPPNNDEIERIKRQIGVFDLARSEGIEMKRMGKNYVAMCVFHKEKTPSLIFTPEKNLFHCPGCKRAGSPIDWVMHRQNVDLPTAIKILKSKLPQLWENSEPAKIEKTEPEKLDILSIEAQRILQRVLEYAVRSMKQNPQALAYLPSRKIISPDLLDEFQIGFLDSSFAEKLPTGREGTELRRHLRDLGILTQSGRVFHQGCVIFPIFDKDGRIVQIYGRRIESREHLNLAQPLRGFFNYKAFISREVILCESTIDALSFWVNGFRHVTCVLGTNGLTPDHLKTFSENKAERVFIAYDNDPAGNDRAAEHSSLLAGLGVHCLRIEFPKAETEKKMDANEYIQRVKEPAESLRLLLSSAKPLGSVVSKTTETTLFTGVLGKKADKFSYEKIGLNHLFALGNRTYKIVGLEKNTSPESLKVYVKLIIENKSYSDNNIDLHSAKDRKGFVRNAAEELETEEEVIKKDITSLLAELEALQAEHIASLVSSSEQREIILTPEEREAALELLRDPKLLERITRDFEKIGLVGEEANALIGYIAATSRKSDKPLAIIIQSSSGAGKTTLMDKILSLMPSEDVVKYSAMTGQSLFYMDKNLKNKILAIVEEEGAQRVSYSLKLLQSEGRISIASTGKDPVTGKMITHEYTVEGPVMLMISTTQIDIDPELLNRCLILTVNETREQTRKIQEMQRRQETLEGMFRKSEKEKIIKVHQNAQRLLRDLWVNNIFANDLTFADTSHRMRRDQAKYLSLIRSVTLLLQYQREIKTARVNGGYSEYIDVALKDVATVHQVAAAAFGATLDEVPPVTRRLLEDMHSMTERLCKERKIDQEDLRITRREIRETTGMGNTQLGIHLRKLEELEFILPHKGKRGQSIVYELLYHGEGKDGKHFIKALADIEKLEKKYRKKLENP